MSPKKVCWVFLNGGRVSGFQVAKCQVPVLSGPQLLPGTGFCGEGICMVCSDRLVMSAMDGAGDRAPNVEYLQKQQTP